MVIWFIVIGVLGADQHLGWRRPSSRRSTRLEAVRFLVADPLISFAVIGAVFLALTGGEALYADMGHVGPTAIRRAWFGLVLPALILNYFGQGALILADPTAADNPFYKLAPSWALIPMVGLAALATIIASQSLISGVFSLTRQAMLMGLCPRARIVPTSSDEEGQIYVPAANWLLMTGTLLTVTLVQDIGQSGGGLRHRRIRNDADHNDPALSRRVDPLGLAAGCRGSGHRGLRRDRRHVSRVQFDEDRRGWLVSGHRRRGYRGPDVMRGAEALSEVSAASPRHVDAAPRSSSLRRQNGYRPGAGTGGLAHQSRARRVADAASAHRAQSRPARDRGPVDLCRRPPAARAVPERHAVQRLGHGFYRIQVKLGFMQTPDIPLSLINCNKLGFDADLEHKNYYLAHETIVRRARDSAMGPISFAIFSFLNRIASRAPDFFKIPHDAVIEVGFRVEI